MKCPQCTSERSTVVKTTKYDDTNRRVRHCEQCNHVWVTWEVKNSANRVITPTK